MRPARLLPLAALAVIACTATPVPREVHVEGLMNGIEYGDLLFAGQPDANALGTLAASGYKTVVSTRGVGEIDWNEEEAVEDLGMAWHSIPMGKPLDTITPEQVDALDQVLATAERPILLHCGSGNRVAGLWAVWLVQKEGEEPAEALERASKVGMTKIRPLIEKTLGVTPAEGN